MPYTKEAVERGAKALAEALNGGAWEVDYTPTQQELWRSRVRAMANAADGA
jgi:hypothetical protein